MQIRIIDKNHEYIRFVVKGITPSLANTLRRIMLSEVPSMAIDEVVIIENSSILHDKILSLRLGLIPIKTDLDSYNLPEECSCKSEFGCNLCRAVLTLDAQALDDVKTIYSGDLISEDPHIAAVSDKIPIVKLAPGQKVKIEAYARLGKGKVHAKWQPVSQCIYRYMPKIKIDIARCDVCRNCIEICPQKILTKERNKIKIQNLMECTLCEDCVKVCSKDPSAIEISRDGDSFIFELESTGVLPIEQIVSEAFKIVNKKFSDFLNLLAGKKHESKEGN